VKLPLATFLPYRLNVLAATVSESLATLYARRFGIDIPQWRVLATLGEFERMTARDVCAHAKMNKTTASRAVAALHARGLVRREVDRADARQVFLSLKPKGRQVYEALVPEALDFAARLVDGLDTADRAALERILVHLTARATPPAAGRQDEARP